MPALIIVALGVTLGSSALLSLPGLVVDVAQRTSPEVLFTVDTEHRLLALTIDDGPSPATAEILDVLRDAGASATFFLIGEHLEGEEATVLRILEEGHEVGHHMMTDTPSRELDPELFEERFDQMHERLELLAPTRLFRPGSGWYDDRMIEVAAARGYRTVLGSVYPFDAQIPWVRFHSWYLQRNAEPGAIVVLHDGEERGMRTAEVLRRVLPELMREGYEVVTVSRLLEAASPGQRAAGAVPPGPRPPE
jgi:peptidoglycan-N-acetylglucosamine deacetylase